MSRHLRERHDPSQTRGAFHLAKISGSISWNANGTQGSKGNFPEQMDNLRSCSTFFVATDRNGNMLFHLHDGEIFPAISNVLLWAGTHWLTCKIHVVVKMAEKKKGEKMGGCKKTPKKIMMKVHLDIFNTIPNCGCNKLLQFKHFVCFFTGPSHAMLERWEDFHVKLLVSCWQKQRLEFGKGKAIKKDIFNRIANEYNSISTDVKVTGEQCSRKWLKLEASHKKITDHNNTTYFHEQQHHILPWNGVLYREKSKCTTEVHFGEQQQHCRRSCGRRLQGKWRWWRPMFCGWEL